MQDSLYIRVAESIGHSIRTDLLGRGERLPSLRETARRHGVSLATAVQAYRTLEDMRLIETRPRSGHYVAARQTKPPEPEITQPAPQSCPVDMSSLPAEVMRLANEPGYLSFGAAAPSSELFPGDRIRRAVAHTVQRHGHVLAEYALGPGHPTLRKAVARHALRQLGCSLQPDDIVITNGCLHAITLCLRTVTQPGDIVALESPTYFGFLEILQSLGLRALEIPTHPRNGMSLDALQLALDTQPVKAILAVPTLSNPMGTSMPLAERRRLASMLEAHRVPLVEDVLYNDLAEQEDKRRAVRSFDSGGNVMICGSFSKTVAPGIRLGWVDAGRWSADVRQLKLATTGSQTTLLELALADLLTQAGGEAASRKLRRTISGRVDEARSIIAESFPKGTRVTDPAGGFILWVEMPAELDSRALFFACLAEHICIAPGTMFSAGDRYLHCIRLGVGGRWDDCQRAALRRVGELATRMLRSQPTALPTPPA